MSFQEREYKNVIRQKVADSLVMPVPAFTRWDVSLPGVPGKAVTIVGMRRSLIPKLHL